MSKEAGAMAYMHCAQCGREKPPGVSMEGWARLSVFLHGDGVYVWCRRHDRSVTLLTPETLGQMMAARAPRGGH